MGQPLAIVIPLLLRLSIEGILFLRTNQSKITTLGGAFNFHMLCITLLSLDLLDIVEKKEETEKVTSYEAVQTLASSPLRDEHTIQKAE